MDSLPRVPQRGEIPSNYYVFCILSNRGILDDGASESETGTEPWLQKGFRDVVSLPRVPQKCEIPSNYYAFCILFNKWTIEEPGTGIGIVFQEMIIHPSCWFPEKSVAKLSFP